tara:strand:- start:13201 stop:13605 length:405 start_codon:yes stop_codon:yes gene_type:complete
MGNFTPSDQKSKALRRDLELVILGMALAASSREETLAKCPEGFLSAEQEALMQGVRNKDARSCLIEWLKGHGAVLEKDCTAADAIIQAIHESNCRASLNRIAINVNNSVKLGTVDQVINSLENALQVAKGISGE